MSKVVLGILLVGSITAAVACSSASENQDAVRDFDAVYREAFELCEEIALPNSMARPEGFDITAHVTQLAVTESEIIRVFYSQEGVEYLESLKGRQTDELEIYCTEKFLSRAREEFSQSKEAI